MTDDLKNPMIVDDGPKQVHRPPPSTFRKSSTAEAREEVQKGERDEGLALDIAKTVATMHPDGVLDKDEFTEYCEQVWQWVTTDTWPPAGSSGSSSDA